MTSDVAGSTDSVWSVMIAPLPAVVLGKPIAREDKATKPCALDGDCTG